MSVKLTIKELDYEVLSAKVANISIPEGLKKILLAMSAIEETVQDIEQLIVEHNSNVSTIQQIGVHSLSDISQKLMEPHLKGATKEIRDLPFFSINNLVALRFKAHERVDDLILDEKTTVKLVGFLTETLLMETIKRR